MALFKDWQDFADKKSAEARFRGCESERPINSKRDRYDSRDSGKASVSFFV